MPELAELSIQISFSLFPSILDDVNCLKRPCGLQRGSTELCKEPGYSLSSGKLPTSISLEASRARSVIAKSRPGKIPAAFLLPNRAWKCLWPFVVTTLRVARSANLQKYTQGAQSRVSRAGLGLIFWAFLTGGSES
jgi:hypothetical protein